MFKIGQHFTLKFDGLTTEGEGIGSLDGFKVFVEGVLPGEEATISLTEIKKRYGRGKVLKLLVTSPLRVKPPCPVFGKCGGCQLQHLSYEGQLKAKTERVLQAFKRIGHMDDVIVEPCIASPTHFSYRNKIQLPVAITPKGITIGLYAQNSHEIVPIDHCLIHSELGEEVFSQIKRWLNESKLTAYDEFSGVGELRHCMIKTAVYTGEVLVTLITNGPGSGEIKKLAEAIFEIDSVKGVVQNINDYRNNTILGSEYRTLCGVPFIHEEICGLTFKISSASFFQVNPAQAEYLYQHAIGLADIQGDEKVIDAYCGVGTLSLLLAQKAKHVIGIECVPEAIEDAKKNAELNGISNVTFYCQQTEKALGLFKDAGIVFINPPRKGCEPEVIQALCKAQPEKIVYVSCDPATLARDVALLCESGYQIVQIQPFDMFPQTAHVETVVQLSKNNKLISTKNFS